MANYEEELKNLDFYKLHPSYLPFVGSKYDEYKILHIGESHYCFELDVNKYNIDYFMKWFDKPCVEVENEVLKSDITRRVVNGMMKPDGKSFAVFDNVLRSFLCIIENEQEPHITKSNRDKYNHFAFMNFYPFPAFESKGCFPNALSSFGKKNNRKEAAEQLLRFTEKRATEIVDEVIDILQPRCVVFSTCAGWQAYANCGGKYQLDERMIYTSHSGKPWFRALKSLKGKRGIDVFENGLKRIYNK